MAKEQVLRFLLWTFSFPIVVISRCFEIASSSSFRNDLQQCLDVIDQFGKSIPYPFVGVLIQAEDHRNAHHPGVDPIGMIRAVWVFFIRSHTQGASTIEQQFVRVVTGRYKRSLARKLREQILAIAVARQRPKRSIASAYLSIAFFGSGCVGLDGMKSYFGRRLQSTSAKEALLFVSQLKYPRPLQPNQYWHSKINKRCEAIWIRRKLASKKSLKNVRSEPKRFPIGVERDKGARY